MSKRKQQINIKTEQTKLNEQKINNGTTLGENIGIKPRAEKMDMNKPQLITEDNAIPKIGRENDTVEANVGREPPKVYEPKDYNPSLPPQVGNQNNLNHMSDKNKVLIIGAVLLGLFLVMQK